MGNKNLSHWPITLTNSFAAILNVFLPIILVRVLTPDQVGRYKIFFLYILLSPGLFLTSGLTNGLYHWTGRYPETKPELRQSWTLFIIVCLLCSALGLLFAGPLASLVKAPAFDLRMFLVIAPLFLVANFCGDLLIARGDIWVGSLYTAGFSVLMTLGILIAAWWSRQVEGILWVYLAVSALKVIAGWIIHSKSGELRPLFSADKSSMVLRYAGLISLASVVGIVAANFDQMILSWRLSAAQFAFYATGCLSLPPLDILEMSVNRVLIPKLAQTFALGDRARAAALFSDAVSELWYFLLLATAGLVVYSRPIILVLFTEKYAIAAQYLRFYAFSFLILAIPQDAVARARADGAWILKLTLVSTPLTLLLTWMATNRWNAMGALFAVLGMKTAQRLYSLIYDRKYLDVPFSQFFPSRTLLSEVGAVLVAAAVVLPLQPLFQDVRVWFLVTGPLFALLYFGITHIMFAKHWVPKPVHVLPLSLVSNFMGLEKTGSFFIGALVPQDRSPDFKTGNADLSKEERSIA